MAQTILEYLNKRFGKEMVSRMAKLSEEFEELQNAFHYGSREDFIDELADLNGRFCNELGCYVEWAKEPQCKKEGE